MALLVTSALKRLKTASALDFAWKEIGWLQWRAVWGEHRMKLQAQAAVDRVVKSYEEIAGNNARADMRMASVWAASNRSMHLITAPAIGGMQLFERLSHVVRVCVVCVCVCV